MCAAIAAGVDALMVTHAAIPAFDPSGTPASLSRAIVTGVVRNRLGYRGLVMTDSLAMGGLSAHIKSIPDAAVQAIEAGNDVVLIAADVHTIRDTLTALDRAVFSGHIPVATVNAAARRILTLKARLGLLPR
jgi:beta-N-acetylhexosaminidase